MTQAQSGNTVKIHYSGTLDDGTQFDSSEGREPLEFEVGSGQVIPGFEKAVEGMSVGESKTINIPAEEAYGPHQPELVQDVPNSALPEDLTPIADDRHRAFIARALDPEHVHGSSPAAILTGCTIADSAANRYPASTTTG